MLKIKQNKPKTNINKNSKKTMKNFEKIQTTLLLCGKPHKVRRSTMIKKSNNVEIVSQKLQQINTVPLCFIEHKQRQRYT